MGLWSYVFGGRRRREARRALVEEVERLLAGQEPGAAWRALEAGLADDPEPREIFHLAGRVLRMGGETATAELFDRAADAPHDLERLLELGAELLGHGQPSAAAAVLERALRLAPFDAVVRSELAIAQARAGRPHQVVQTLALHPCLADDPGALFQFGWASLLTGDLDAAEGALATLRGAARLRQVLEHALARARVGSAASPPDARDFLFVEHGALLVDAGGPLAGRYDVLSVDAGRARQLLAGCAAAVQRLVSTPRRVAIWDERQRGLAEALAEACGGRAVEARDAGRSDLVVLDRADRLAEGVPEPLHAEHLREALVIALTMELAPALPRAPDIVGALARTVELQPGALASFLPGVGGLAPELESFVEARQEWLAPRRRTPRIAYVPDAPLPR